jgi:hypothetical protein
LTAQRVPPPGKPYLETWERVLRDLAVAGGELSFRDGRFVATPHDLSPAQEAILTDHREAVLALMREYGEGLMDCIREEWR